MLNRLKGCSSFLHENNNQHALTNYEIDELYCTFCESLQQMKTIVPGTQVVSEKRIYVDRVRRCLACGKKYVTAEVLSDLVHEYDQTRRALNHFAESMNGSTHHTSLEK